MSKKPFLRKVVSFVAAPVKFAGKVPRETIRIIDQGLNIGNKAIEKTGLDKILGGNSVGVSTISGSRGGSNVHFTPAGSSNSIGIGISNAGNASLFIGNQVVAPLTTPPPANFIEKTSERITITSEDSIDHKIAERDQLLQEAYGPGYIPESSLATMGIAAIYGATKQFLHDNAQLAKAVTNIYMDTYVNIYSANDKQRSEAWVRNQEMVTNAAQAVSNAFVNPRILEAYYSQKFQEASNSFANAYNAGNLIKAGTAAGHTVYDVYTIFTATTAANTLTTKAVSCTAKVANNFVATNKFRPPMVFQFDVTQLNSGIPFDTVKLQNPVVPKSQAASNVNAQAAIKQKLNALQKVQKLAVKTENLPDGRIRYYARERLAKTPGPTHSSAYVTEHNLNTGQIRSWIENYDHSGNVNRVHPKMLNGQDIIGQHYPPTKTELESWFKKLGGPK